MADFGVKVRPASDTVDRMVSKCSFRKDLLLGSTANYPEVEVYKEDKDLHLMVGGGLLWTPSSQTQINRFV